MKEIKILIFMLILGGFGLTGCSDDDNEAPLITSSVYELGQEGNSEQIVVPIGTDVAYSFKISSSVGLKYIELWGKSGVGINKEDAKLFGSWSSVDFIDINNFSISDTIDSLSNDVQYSVYVQDINDNYCSTKVNCFLNVLSYSQTLTDGAAAATSATFLNLESGMSYYIANTIGDPSGIDLGFTYMENTPYQACLVSFDEYSKTGNYGMVVNDLNPAMTFRNANNAITTEHFEDDAINPSELESIYKNSTEFTEILNFTNGKIAYGLQDGDFVSFYTEDGRFGILRVNEIERKDESIANSQTISFDIIIKKNI